MASTLALEPVIDLVLEQLERVIDYTGARVWLVEGDEMTLVATASALTGRKGDRVPIASRLLIDEVYQTAAPGSSRTSGRTVVAGRVLAPELAADRGRPSGAALVDGRAADRA